MEIMKMITLSDWEQKNFIHSSHTPGITVIFPSREIYFSPELLNVMRLENSTCPKTLDQWYELCHPSDHSVISKLENIIYGHEIYFSISRKLYCGDGVYRNFRLDAFIQRNSDGRPEKLIGNEILALSAWLESSNEGDKIICDDKILEAVRVQGVMTLNNLSMIEDLQNENLRLRREIQRRIFCAAPSEIILPDSDDSELFFANIIENNIDSALNILIGNNQLKSLKRSLRNENIVVGVTGLSGSGKSELVNSLIGEKLIPEHTEIPIFITEGETKSSKIFYQDGRLEEDSILTPSYIKTLKDVSRIEITIPGALIPKGVCIVDSPNKNILPEFDFVIYVIPIRSCLKNSDLEYLRAITSINENIIFVLSQIDLERDDFEAGKLIFTTSDKIKDNIHGLESEIQKYLDINAKIIPVSAKNALEKFYDKNSDSWAESNIENLVNYIKPIGENSFIKGLNLRTERALKIIENTEIKTSLSWKIQDVMENLRNIIPPSAPSVSSRHLPASGEAKFSSTVNVGTKNLLSSLIMSMKERDFKTKFFALQSFAGKRKAVLLSADKIQSLKLFSRLAHNIRSENLSEGLAASKDWLYSGNDEPFECVKIQSLGSDEEILIAPSDYNIDSDFNWRTILNKYIPVVSVDLARIDSGLSDLANSPYITELAFTKWILTFGNAGLFDTRQEELKNDIPELINNFIENNGLKTPDYFIFENYKIIYEGEK
ncbi:MAG: PAS domain-containing protein [Synergistaceae bacterium]|nr:PAS domain-containing protein [Synergistaceae bacterium]